MFLELFTTLKFLNNAGEMEWDAVAPLSIKVSWGVLGVAGVAFYVYLRINDKTRKYPEYYYKIGAKGLTH